MGDIEAPLGFWTRTKKGRVIHIAGDPGMDEETANALRKLADGAVDLTEERQDLFDAAWEKASSLAKGVLDRETAFWWFSEGVMAAMAADRSISQTSGGVGSYSIADSESSESERSKK